MSESIENIELKRFHQSLFQDLKSTQISEEEGGNLEQIFTQAAVDLLVDAGETENVRVAYDEGQLGRPNQHKINAYAEPDNYETVDLFITIFNGTEEPTRVAKEEIDRAAIRIKNFYNKAKSRHYVNDIEESSPIFDFARTLSKSELLDENLVRINAIILTDGWYPLAIPANQEVSGYPIYYRVVDINYLFNISQKTHVPIEIDFKKEGFDIPCIVSPSENELYQSYLAIIPGIALATIYERYGSRLLEQNVRSFLQGAGKTNKGIRKTIREKPYMFLAYNNGIAATAEELIIDKSQNGSGLIISKVKDFQIVNGGQTTASIYHTMKKDKADISEIFVQVKLTVVKNREDFSGIVSDIAKFANTQTKVSLSDLTSNNPFHVEVEKLSRNIFAPHVNGQNHQTKWFYERAKAQYKNARLKEGSPVKQKAFELRNPRKQIITKVDLAKYLNTYEEIYSGKRIVIGPHIVARGNEKNYEVFINHNLFEKPDNIYFEDLVAKAILFRSAEKIYGKNPNAIGEMRYLTVPYSIALLTYVTKNRIDLYKIWKNQSISIELKELLYELMVKVENFIKETAAGKLYGEWAKKEDCWNELKEQNFRIDYSGLLMQDMEDDRNPSKRRRITDAEIALTQIQDELSTIRSLPANIWHKIEQWGRETGLLTEQQKTVAFNLADKVRNLTRTISESERQTAILILDCVVGKAPGLLDEIDEQNEQVNQRSEQSEITIDVIREVLLWDKSHKQLTFHERKLMIGLETGETPLTDRNLFYVRMCLLKMKKFGNSQISSSAQTF